MIDRDPPDAQAEPSGQPLRSDQPERQARLAELTETAFSTSALPRASSWRWLPAVAAVAVIITIAVSAYLWLGAANEDVSTGTAHLALGAAGARTGEDPYQVAMGDSYFATASGFRPGEPVRFFWTGPTNGVMETVVADRNGRSAEGPVIEQDPVGEYRITATGLGSGRTATASLIVVAGP